ncbi:MAG TPA: hypothetical protein VGE97_08055 [Nitrososphaera sp.]
MIRLPYEKTEGMYDLIHSGIKIRLMYNSYVINVILENTAEGKKKQNDFFTSN